MTSHLRATRRHLPYGITQCYLPSYTSELARLTPAIQAGARFTYPGGMEGHSGLLVTDYQVTTDISPQHHPAGIMTTKHSFKPHTMQWRQSKFILGMNDGGAQGPRARRGGGGCKSVHFGAFLSLFVYANSVRLKFWRGENISCLSIFIGLLRVAIRIAPSLLREATDTMINRVAQKSKLLILSGCQ